VINQSKPKVVVIAGPNGAGKSTLAPALLRDTFGLMEYVNADTIAQGLSAFQPETAAFEAGRVMLKRLHNLSLQRVTFAFESTLAGRAHAAWISRACQQGYEFHLLFLWLKSPELAVKRVLGRVRMGGHNIPEDTIRRRYRSGLNNFFRLYRPLTTTWTFYDNSAYHDPLLIATGRSKVVEALYQSDLWTNICENANEPKTRDD
jgi:predicted ABC-type ATPase